MSHVKSSGTAQNQGGNVAGKRRGLKANHGEKVKPGVIIVRQLGTKYHPGKGVKLCKDYSILAKEEGIVQFKSIARPFGRRVEVSVVAEKAGQKKVANKKVVKKQAAKK